MTQKNQVWEKSPAIDVIDSTIKSIESRGINVQLVQDKASALGAIKDIIPPGAEIAKVSSTTLEEIGFFDYLNSSRSGWTDLNKEAALEPDEDRRREMLRKAYSAEYFVGSVNAISQNGELIAVSGSGMGISAYPFTAKRLVLVAGVHKITKNLETGIQRVREYFFPMEDRRVKHKYGFRTKVGKWVIIENEINEDRIHLILVNEQVGF
jgi:hypothetical protein